MDPVSLSIFAAALAVAAGAPGPNIAALVARVLTNGWRDILPFLVAMWIGEAVWLSLAVFGLAAVAQTLHLAFAVIKYLGVAYLLYLAWRMWFGPRAAKEDALSRARSPGRIFAAGMAVSLGNPKIMVFYMALLPSIIDMRHVTLAGWAALTATMVVVVVAVDLSWVALAARARAFFASPGAPRVVNRTGAVIMAGAAAAIAAR